jgi:BirA family transcriptional regulator, biotin operon repressor / biotin---[acetyl-CoA-carboxylase] ligase
MLFLSLFRTLYSITADAACPIDDRFPVPRRDGSLLFYHFESTTSTQDQAKQIMEQVEFDPNETTLVIVTATEQTNGRGTSGRQWIGAVGNTFVTIAMRQQSWQETYLPFTLLPLQMGIIMATRIQEQLKDCSLPSETTLKWPNDVLVDEKKIAGVLIESTSNGWFLIGIGVNVGYTPQVPTQGPNQGRRATSISEYCIDQPSYAMIAQNLGEQMGEDLHRGLLSQSGGTQELIHNWKQWVDWDKQLVLRDGDDKTPVIPLDIEEDGRLRVKEANGNERRVVTDYFL